MSKHFTFWIGLWLACTGTAVCQTLPRLQKQQQYLEELLRVLPKKTQYTTTSPPYDAPQTLMGQTITDEKALLNALVATPDFKFNVCRHAMRFAYGRPEYKCEGPVFDACMASFTAQETMQSALSAVLRHPTYCQ